MNNSQQLIVEKYQRTKQELQDDYSFYLRRIIVKKEGLQGDKVKGFYLSLGKGCQINDDLEICLANNQPLELFFFWKKQNWAVRTEYQLKKHPKLANFYLVDGIKEEFLQTMLDNDFFTTFSITSKNYNKTQDWVIENETEKER